MKKRGTQYLKILLSCMLVISISGGIILGTQLLYKINHKTKEDIMAESNKVVLGDEDIFYVDLTKKPDDYEKINKADANEDEKTIKIENTAQASQNIENATDARQENAAVMQNVVNQLNQDYYDIDVDLDNGTITADGKEADISELLSSEENKEELYNYLQENVIGDIKYQDGKIKIENPYSTKTIMIQTDNLTELDNCGDVESIVRVSKDVYCVHYKDAKATKEGYNILKDNELVDNVAKDAKVSILENATAENTILGDAEAKNKALENIAEKSADINNIAQGVEIDAQQVTGNNYAWGIQSTGVIQYVNKLNSQKNTNEIKVAVLDTGVRTTHEVFKNETTGDRLDLSNAYNYVSSNSDITDDNGHGTMVAGIIAESTSNNVKIVPIKVLGSDGKGDYSVAIQAASAIVDKVDVLNVSLGIDESELPASTKAMGERMLKPIYESGKVIVCASGNNGKEGVYYPASSQYTIGVSAIDNNNQISSFSNYGSTIDFAAPGQGLCLPYYTGDDLYNLSFAETSQEYNKNSGTSFASPFIAADFAMLKSENPKYTIEKMKNILIENCEDLGDSGKDKYYGYGNVNFNTKMFEKPVIASYEITTTESGEKAIDLYAVAGNLITSWAYTTTDEEPTEAEQWRQFSSNARNVHVQLTNVVAGKYYFWIKDEKENVVKQEVVVNADKDDNTTNNTNTSNTIKPAENTTTNNTNNTNTTENIVNNTTTNTVENVVNNTTTNNTVTNDITNNTTNTVENIVNNTTTNDIANNTTTNNTTANDIVNNTISNNTTTNEITNNTTTNNTITNNTTTNDTQNNTNITENIISGTNNTINNNKNSGINNQIKNIASNATDKTEVVTPVTDKSKTSTILPKTGTNRIMILMFVVITVSGIFTFVKYKKMKDVK